MTTDATFLGKPCLHGHDGTRYKSNKHCVECSKSYKEYFAAWKKKNKQRLQASSKKWYEENKVRKRAVQKIWNENNVAARQVHSQNRTSRTRGKRITKQEIDGLFALQRGHCAICKCKLDCYEIDHVVPVALNGEHHISNIQLLCRHCNRTKHSKDPIEFMQSKGYLL